MPSSINTDANSDYVEKLCIEYGFSLPRWSTVPWHATVPTWGYIAAIDRNVQCLCTDGLLFCGIDSSGTVWDRLHIADFCWLKPGYKGDHGRRGAPPPLFGHGRGSAKALKKPKAPKHTRTTETFKETLQRALREAGIKTQTP